MSEHRCLGCEDWQRRDAANKAEIARLEEQVRYEQQRNAGNVALADCEVSRLLEAIKREAEMHALMQGGGACACDICEIAREGR